MNFLLTMQQAQATYPSGAYWTSGTDTSDSRRTTPDGWGIPAKSDQNSTLHDY